VAVVVVVVRVVRVVAAAGVGLAAEAAGFVFSDMVDV
jgi:hypothetical protein